MIDKKLIEQSIITAIVTFIVTTVGVIVFNLNVAIYSGIAAGMSVAVGKKYGNSLIEDSWHWKDVISDAIGIIIGMLIFAIIKYIG